MLLINNRSRSNKTIEKWHKVKAIERWLKRVGGQNFGLKNRAPGGFAHEGGMTVFSFSCKFNISYRSNILSKTISAAHYLAICDPNLQC